MKRMRKKIQRGLQVLALVMLAAVAPGVQAQSAEVMNETGDMVRVMRHPDGTRAIYQRQKGWRGAVNQQHFT